MTKYFFIYIDINLRLNVFSVTNNSKFCLYNLNKALRSELPWIIQYIVNVNKHVTLIIPQWNSSIYKILFTSWTANNIHIISPQFKKCYGFSDTTLPVVIKSCICLPHCFVQLNCLLYISFLKTEIWYIRIFYSFLVDICFIWCYQNSTLKNLTSYIKIK